MRALASQEEPGHAPRLIAHGRVDPRVYPFSGWIAAIIVLSPILAHAMGRTFASILKEEAAIVSGDLRAGLLLVGFLQECAWKTPPT